LKTNYYAALFSIPIGQYFNRLFSEMWPWIKKTVTSSMGTFVAGNSQQCI